MKRQIVKTVFIICITLAAASGYAGAFGEKSSPARFQDGKISVSASKTPFLPLVEQISRKANLKVYMVDQALPDFVSVNVTDLPVEQALGRIFRGCSYAVVYYAPEAVEGGVYIGQNLKPLHNNHVMIASAKESGKFTGSLRETPGGDSLRYSNKAEPFRERRELVDSGAEEPAEPILDKERSAQENSERKPQMHLAMSTVPEEQNPMQTEETEPALLAGGSDAWQGATGESAAIGNHGDSSGSGSEAASDDGSSSGILGDSSSGANSSPANESDDISPRERFLISQIYILEGQIDDGYAKRWYEHWSQIKDPKYIQTHEERLSYYKSELEKFRNQ